MANYNNWYNPALEKLRNDTEKRAYQKRMQILEEKKRNQSIRTVFDIFLNKKARERVGGDNWFETTFKSIGQFFDNNFVEWFRNPANALMNNLSSIGDTLDYAANLIKAPMIAAAKGEDVGERLADAYGLGDKGRIAQNMSDLREVLGAEDPSAEIGVSAGMGAITGAEIGTKVAPGIGTLIGGLIGAGVGTINSSIDVAVRESGTDNAFWKGTQTVGNTITDMMMEYGVDPANFAGAIGDAFKGSNIKNVTDAVASQSLDDMAKQTLDTTESFTKSLNGEQAYKVKDIMDHMYKSTAESVTKPRLDKAGKEIKVTAEQQRKQFNRKISNILKSYMDNDKKNFNKYFLETGIGRQLSDNPSILDKQLDDIFKTLRHDANMSKVGRIAAFIDRFDAGFAKKLYKGTVPGLTVTSAVKGFMKAHDAWEKGLLTVAQTYGKDIIDTSPKEVFTNDKFITRLARQHYFNTFKKAGILYEIPEGATADEINKIYESMSNDIKTYFTYGNHREYQVLKGLRKGITLDNGTVSVNLGKAESDFKKIIKFINGDATISKDDYATALDKLTDLFYFNSGIDYFQSLLFDPTYFKGDWGQVEKVTESIITRVIDIVAEEPINKYTKEIESIINKTVDFDNFRIATNDFYSNELHQSISKLLDSMDNHKYELNNEQQTQLYKDLNAVLNVGYVDEDTLNRVAQAVRSNMVDSEVSELYATLTNVYSKELGLNLSDDSIRAFMSSRAHEDYVKMYDNIEDALVKYNENNRLIGEGTKLRDSFMRYRNAIDDTKDTYAASDIAINKTLKLDREKLHKQESDRIVAIYNNAFKNIAETNHINMEELDGLTNAIRDDLRLIIGDLDNSDLTTYDVMLHFNNILSVGSARLNNFIKYSQIKNTNEFLNNFTDGIKKSNRIANDKYLKGQHRVITDRLNKLTKVLDDLDFNYIDSKIKLLSTIGDNKLKFINKAITDFIFKGLDLPDSVKVTIANESVYNKLVSTLNAVEYSVDLKEIRYLYDRLTSEFTPYTFNRGRNPLEAITNVINTLTFASENGFSNMTNGVFVDNLIQQTIYDTVIKEVNQVAVENVDDIITDKTAKTIFENVFNELNINSETRETINDALTRLYAERNELINRLSILDAEKSKASSDIAKDKISGTQRALIKRFKRKNDSLFSKLNTLTTAMFVTNMNTADFSLKNGKEFSNLVNNLKLLKGKNVPVELNNLITKTIASKINEQLLDSKSWKDALRIINDYALDDDLLTNNALLRDLFNSIGGIYKADYIRVTTFKNIGLTDKSIGKPINKMMQTTKALQEWYISHFNDIVNGNIYISGKDVIKFNGIITEYKNALNTINDLLSKDSDELDEALEIKSIDYNKITLTDFSKHYVENFRYGLSEDDAIKSTLSGIFEEPYISSVSINSDNKCVINSVPLSDLYNKDSEYFNKLFTLPIIDLETDTESGLIKNGKTVPGYENIKKSVLQYTIRDNNDNAINFLIANPKLTNDYKANNPDLLDASFVNDDYLKIADKLGPDNSKYTMFEKDGVSYIRFKNKKAAAEAIIEDLKIKGILDNNSTLSFVGHNAAAFDADVLMRFINEQFPNTIKNVQVVDTMWLARAVMAADGIFKDDASATLGNVFEHWFPDELDIIEGAHNANVDTYMNYKIMQYIKNRLGNNPAEFFKRTFSMAGSAFIEDNAEAFDIIRNTYVKSLEEFRDNITLDEIIDDLLNKKIKNRELNVSVSDDYANDLLKNYIQDANDLIDMFEHVDSLDKLKKFIRKYESFEYKNYTNEAKYEEMYNNLAEIYARNLGLDLKDKRVKSYVNATVTDALQGYIHNIDDSELNNIYSELVNKYQNRMTAIYGNKRVFVRLNREYAIDYTLDGYSSLLTDKTDRNTLQEIMGMLDANSLDDLHNAEPNSVIGDILYNLLNQYKYNKELLFNDFPEVKQFYDYSNRINAHLKFRQDLYTVIDKYATKNNYKDVRQVFYNIMTLLTGYGSGDRASIDTRLVDFIRQSPDELLKDTVALKSNLSDIFNASFLNLFNDNVISALSDNDQSEVINIIYNYITDCIDHIDDYLESAPARYGYAFTILRPAPDREYVNLMESAFGTHNDGLLSKYQSMLNRIKAKDPLAAKQAQDYDRLGFDYVKNALRERLSFIRNTDDDNSEFALPTAYVETVNNKSSWEMNNSGCKYTFKSGNEYTRDWTEVNESANAIYKAFKLKYDPATAGASTYRNVESKFHTLVKNIQQDWGLTKYQIEQASDIAALDDPVNEIQRQVLIDYFNTYITDSNEFYKDFNKSIMNYKKKDLDTITDIEKRMIETKKLEDSSKAFIASAYLQGNAEVKLDPNFIGPAEKHNIEPNVFIISNMLNDASKSRIQRKLEYAVRYMNESNNFINGIFTDADGNVNYAAMLKYINSNSTMRISALIPSDRFNNMNKETKQYQMSGEFITLKANSPEELRNMLTHDSSDGIRYFITDEHNLRTLKQSIDQTISNKTYINRELFNNNPTMKKFMDFRNIIAKYILMPTKVLGLQNLGFTVTNMFEAIIKTMTATTGNRADTIKQYGKAMTLHRKWSQATGEIANAIKGSPFYRNKNQWTAMLQELENSSKLFGPYNVDTISDLLKKNKINNIKSMLPSINDFTKSIKDSEYITQYYKQELIRRYKKLFTKSQAEQNDAVRRLAERYVNVNKAYADIVTKYNKDEFDFVTEFVNSPAAAAEMQSIKKANIVNAVGNKTRRDSSGKIIKKDSAIDRFYKKALFSDWGMGEHNPFRVITPYFNLSLNSDIETINRLALHMDLLDKGFTKSESYNRVLSSFFNYGDKSEGELLAEMIFPFISFPFRTTLFWDEMLDEHPQLIKLFADLVLTNWGKDAQNQYNQTGITKGGLKITNDLSVETGSSFLDSLAFGGNALNILGNRKLNPLLGPLVEGAKQLTTGEANWDYRLSRMPLIGKVMYGQDLVNHLMKGEHHLYDIAPSIFNNVYEQNRYYYRNQGQYAYRSTYSRLYYASGGNRWNSRNRSKAVNMLVKK